MGYRVMSTQEDLRIKAGEEGALRQALIGYSAPDDSTLISALEWVGFGDATRRSDGTIHIGGACADSEMEDVLLVMAPYLEGGSSIAWVGEDQALWINVVLDGTLYEAAGEIVPVMNVLRNDALHAWCVDRRNPYRLKA